MKELFIFIRWIPAYFRLFKHWCIKPDDIDFALTEYETVISILTGGRLSKVLYESHYVVEEVQKYFCEDCDLKS